ncbi:MAG: carboxymuconolactone decarboxylase family protein [Leptospiraceae bacterium]|nr:carboxymuconolactone decarboxylase family protein [Leptospiraceae bacterium]
MKPRMNYYAPMPEMVGHLQSISELLRKSDLDQEIYHLVQIRASQLNHCAFCLDMHVKEARMSGIGELKLHTVAAWEESPLFSDRERIALQWAETVTLVSETHIPDDAYAAARSEFSEKELALLTMAVVTINAWNRLAVSFRPTPGSLDKQLGLEKAALSA